MDELDRLFYLISRSHSFWGRKPLKGLIDIFRPVKKGDLFVDPFCGGGTPVLAALIKGAKVIANDINPMAIFLTEVLIQPINLSSLNSIFIDLKKHVSQKINSTYQIRCNSCNEMAHISYIAWKKSNLTIEPEIARIKCNNCGSYYAELNNKKGLKQFQFEGNMEGLWFPKTKITSSRKIPEQ
ncbi:MAG: hypothetical protein D4R67_03770, partial [Bacteroidetes bacterium]